MYRAATILLVFFTIFFTTFAAPVPVETDASLNKRITHSGRGTWFNVGLGNCGWTNNDGDMIVAISKGRYDNEGGSNCGQWMEITNSKTGATAYAQTADSCPGCGWDDLDMSPAAFSSLGNLDDGVMQVSWHFMARGWSP